MTTFSHKGLSMGLTLVVGLLTTSRVIADDLTEGVRDSSTRPSEIITNKVSPIKKPALPISDVALSEEGVIRGRVLNGGNGKPIDGARVVIRRGDELLHKMVTDKQGQFEAKGLRAGVYTIATVHGSGLYRLWPKNIAPPSARTQALVMTQEPVSRAQFGGSGLTDWAAIGVGAAGLTVSIITLENVNDLEDKVDALKSP